MAHLITGYAGHEHIQSADQGSFNAAFFGGGQYVMESGNQFEASIIDNNTVRILGGDLLMYGRHVRIEPDTYEDMTIDTGAAGQTRIDLICMTYEKNAIDGTEKAFLEVVKGKGTEGTVQVPEYTNGNILAGAVKNQMPLYQVNINGVVLSNITPLFTVIPTYKTLAERYAAQFEATIKALKSANILDNMEEIEANTQEKMIAGALAVKEGFRKINNALTSFKLISNSKSFSASISGYISVPTKDYEYLIPLGVYSESSISNTVLKTDNNGVPTTFLIINGTTTQTITAYWLGIKIG